MELLISFVIKIFFLILAFVFLFKKGIKYEIFSISLIIMTIVANYMFFL